MEDVLFWRDKWTDAEKDHVRQRYMRVSTYDLALDLRRTPQAIRSQATKLGLRRPPANWKFFAFYSACDADANVHALLVKSYPKRLFKLCSVGD